MDKNTNVIKTNNNNFNELKVKKNLLYVGINEENRLIIMTFIIGKRAIQLKLTYKCSSFIITLGYNLLDRYNLINKIEKVINTKEKQNLNLEINKYSNLKNYSVDLIYENNDYYIVININSTIYKFIITNINELLDTLKEGLILPGDRFNGLEIIEPIKYKDSRLLWKVKCLLCEKKTEVLQNHLKRNKSCGCLNGSNFDSEEERFYTKVDKQENIPKELQIRGTLGIDEEPCWLWTGCKNEKGYGHSYGDNSYKASHRYSWEIHNDEKLDNPKILICHRCDNPSCVNPNHLFKGTPIDNVQDMINKGRQAWVYGEKCSGSKLTEEQVLTIRNEKIIKRGDKARLGKKYGVIKDTIYSILNRKTWKHLL